MKTLKLWIIGNNDVATICTEEATNAGHEVISIRECAELTVLTYSGDEILIYCSPHSYSQTQAIPTLTLSFNEAVLLQDKVKNAWFISTTKQLFKPIQQDLVQYRSCEELIRDTFLEIICDLARETMPIIAPCSEITGSIFKFDEKHLYLSFLTCVQRYPNHTALIYEETELTYQQLEEAVAKQALYLSPTSNKLIGLYFRRNLNLIIALLAVLKLDAAYIPLDPKNPQARNQTILQDAQVEIVLCDNDTAFSATHFSGVHIINVDHNATTDLTLNEEIRYDNPVAYVIYTSGSTGKPKGVLCTHEGALNMVKWTIATYPITPHDRVIQLASYAFDISVWEIFAALLSGATLILAKDDGYKDPAYIAELVAMQQITIAHMIPSILNLFLERIQLPSTLTHVVSGGEELRPAIANRFFSKLPETKLYHGYGPTECAITCIHHEVKYGTFDKCIPIGLPIANTTLYVVDHLQRVKPLGEEGEALITGAGIAKGYLNNSAETISRFINGEIYKTGDIVKSLPDETVQFIGRIDQQLKVRGNRIELGEIERVLQACPRVTSSAIITVDDKETVIIGFCSLKKNCTLTEVNQYLKTQLPYYMLPSQLLEFTDVPRTVNGKIDKNKLHSFYINSVSHIDIDKANYNDIEMMLINYLNKELRLNLTDLDAELIACGLNSLSFIYLINFIESTYQVKFTPSELFQANNLRNIAQLIAMRRADNITLIGRYIGKISRHTTLPLSNAQARLWFLHQLEDQASAAYNILKTYDLGTEVNTLHLAQALSHLISRHEILRTVFKSVNGRPHQIISDVYTVTLKPEELSEQDLINTIIIFARHYFDLSRDRLIQFKLFKNSTTQHYFLAILQHNIITDGWSGGILIKEINHFYATHTALPAPELQYADYAAWQNKRLTSTVINNNLLYWQQKLSQFTPLHFPLDKVRPPRTTTNGAVITIELDKKQLTTVFQYIQQAGVTLYTYLVTVLNIMLARYADQTDILIGTGYAGRDKEELKNMLGFFVNTLPLRTCFTTHFKFVDALNACKQTILEALSHSEIPFDVLVDKLKIEREPHISPLFQILFLMQDAADNIHLNLEGFIAQELSVDLGVAIFDITFNVLKSDKGIQIAAQYNTDLFMADSIKHFLEHYAMAITYLAKHPEEEIYKFVILNDYDVKHLIAFHHENTDIALPNSLIDIWQTTCTANNEKIALCELNEKRNLCYEELDKLSDIIARAVFQRFGKDNIIAIYLPKSMSFFITMLGILKSGNTYLIIDTEMPKERVQYILSDSGATAVVMLNNKTHHETACVTILYDEMKVGEADVKLPSQSAEIAYILYTSGSTGKPKGVCISQQNLLNAINFFREQLGTSKLLSLTATSFDIFQLEAYLPLLTGGCCYFYNKPLSEILPMIESDIQTQSVDLIQATPSAWKWLLQYLHHKHPSINILIGGENSSWELITRLREKFNHIYHVYGPTETTIWSSMTDFSMESVVHLGKPIHNTTLLIVDSRLQLVPVGCSGELIIAGKSVSPGYFGAGKQHNDKFFNHHYREILYSSQRFYRTGDKVRLQHNGILIYESRLDEQIKLRGYRIELNEIIHVIKSYPNIQDAFVIIVQSNEAILVAFILTHITLNNEDLQRYLSDRLPHYMLPQAFIAIREWPLNTNGKIDKFKLTRLYDEHMMGNSKLKNKKLNPIEKQLQSIWANCLQISCPNIETNFFNLGGSSLLITELITEVNMQFNTNITVRDFINEPTIELQAKRIAQTTILTMNN